MTEEPNEAQQLENSGHKIKFGNYFQWMDQERNQKLQNWTIALSAQTFFCTDVPSWVFLWKGAGGGFGGKNVQTIPAMAIIIIIYLFIFYYFYGLAMWISSLDNATRISNKRVAIIRSACLFLWFVRIPDPRPLQWLPLGFPPCTLIHSKNSDIYENPDSFLKEIDEPQERDKEKLSVQSEFPIFANPFISNQSRNCDMGFVTLLVVPTFSHSVP